MAATKKALLALERQFWEAMTSGDFEQQFSLMTPEVVVSTAQGSLTLDHQRYKSTSEKWPIQIHSFDLVNESVLFPVATVAIVSYDAEQDVTMNEKRQSLSSHCTSTWIHVNDRWHCCSHVDIPAQKKSA